MTGTYDAGGVRTNTITDRRTDFWRL